MRNNYFIIGLSGATNAGKTTLCEHIKKDFPKACVINMDDFYVEEDSDKLNMVAEVNHANWDELSAVNIESLHRKVEDWIEGQNKEQEKDSSPSILILEGILIFNYRPLASLFDKKYFLTITKDKCWERRKERVYIPPDPPGYFDVVVWPMYLKNLENLADQKDIEYLDGSEDQELIYRKVYEDISVLFKK